MLRSLNRVGTQPTSLPLSADEIVEFHAARLLLLMKVCGISGRIDGLTKMAKLDFFARYPDFFEAARSSEMPSNASEPSNARETNKAVESAMIRHHYVLAHLEAKHLITVVKKGNSYNIALTDVGNERAEALVVLQSFAPIVARMRDVKKTFGSKTGTYLKNLIYHLFDEQVGRRPMGKRISS
jgi:hypothetical protein